MWGHQKAISPLVSHTIFTALGIILITIIALTVFSLYNRSTEENIRTQLNQINQQVADEIIKLYNSVSGSTQQPSVNSSLLLGRTELLLPKSVSGRTYVVTLREVKYGLIYLTNVSYSGANLTRTEERPYAQIVSRSSQPLIEATTNVRNIEIKMQGSASGGTALLEYYRYNFNGNTEDVIALGEPKILIEVQGIR